VVFQDGKDMLALRRTLSVYDKDGYYRKFLLMGKGSDVIYVPAQTPGLLKGMGRVWVFLSHHNSPGYPGFVEGVFSGAGKQMEKFDRPGIALFLYSLPGGK
jgi:hypothetical protein